MGFLIMAGLLLTLACLWATLPLWKREVHHAPSQNQANVLAYHSRLAEIDRDAEAGLLAPEQAESLKIEQAQRLTQEGIGRTVLASQNRTLWALPVLFGLISAVSLGLYYQRGSWKTAQQIAEAPSEPQPAKALPPEAVEMVQRLEKKLEANPQDAEGWALLGRSYFVMERFAEAAKAYGQANTIKADNPEWLTGEGEALGLSRDRDLVGKPQQLFEAALKLAPEDGKSLWYASLAAAQANDFKTATAHLQRLSKQELPETMRVMVNARLQEFAQLSGGAVAPSTPASTLPSTPAKASSVAMAVTVNLSPALQGQTPPGTMLFVFAKAKGKDGEAVPPMPLAVQRVPVGTFPVTMTLDSSMGMVDGLNLAAFDNYEITARISKGGDVKAQSGDWQGKVAAQKSDKTVSLTITEVVP